MAVCGSPANKAVIIGVGIAIVVLLVPFSVYCSKPPAPTAAFTASYVSGELLTEDPISGTVPLTVKFNDRSSGEITLWRWNLGDGTIVKGSDEASRNPVHTYITTSTAFIVTLMVQGPGGENQKLEYGIVTVLECSEAANSELSHARRAIQACLSAAGRTGLDSFVPAWDGSRGQATAGSKDAADYLGVWKTFKATYEIGEDGTIRSGTDVSWGCVFWDPLFQVLGGGWRAK
jgi:PKD repeat protein